MNHLTHPNLDPPRNPDHLPAMDLDFTDDVPHRYFRHILLGEVEQDRTGETHGRTDCQ